tara:strand:+ start:1188 stop:1748 length:561 start_codon:yes stop_codon:yes gene_type:complete
MIYKKLFDLQQEIGKIQKKKENPFFKSQYFDINELLAQLMPLLKKHELVILQPLSYVDGRPAITTVVKYVGGEEDNPIFHTVVLPDLDDPQKMGSCITYYRRYSLQSLLGLQAEDDDGNKASGGKSPQNAKYEAYDPSIHTKVNMGFVEDFKGMIDTFKKHGGGYSDKVWFVLKENAEDLRLDLTQ